MYQITIVLPEETALALKLTPEQLGEEMRLAAAVKLYELGKLSSGAAANLAGVPKVIFLSKLAEYGVDSLNFRLAVSTPTSVLKLAGKIALIARKSLI